MVPNIKDADSKSIFQIAEEIVDLVDRADERKIDLQGFRGGTFSISNYGAIGGLFATPVINYPEVAILGMGRVQETPVVREGKIVTRLDAAAGAHVRSPAGRRRRGGALPQPGHRLPGGSRPAASGRGLTGRRAGGLSRLRRAPGGHPRLRGGPTRSHRHRGGSSDARSARRVRARVTTKRLMVGRLASLGDSDSDGRPSQDGESSAEGVAAAAGRRVALAVSGLDKVNAAHLLTCLLQAMMPRPRLVLQIGIAGALPAERRLRPGFGRRRGDRHSGGLFGHGELESGTAGCRLESLAGRSALSTARRSGGVFPLDGRLAAAALEVVVAGSGWGGRGRRRRHQTGATSPGRSQARA